MNNMSEVQEMVEEINTLKKSLTGINGFDELTFGGLPLNRPTILVGSTGTGKTFMSMQYLIQGALKFDEPGVFMTFEEKSDELHENMSNLGYDLKGLIKENKIYLEHLMVSPTEIHEVGRYNIEGLFVRLKLAIDKIQAKRVVLDAFDTLFSSLDSTIMREEFKRLFLWLKAKKVTAIITAEMGDNYLTRLGLEENVADCVIELNNRVSNQIGIRRIRIIKYRGSYHANNEFPFVIDENGMTIFPSISRGIEQIVSEERISSGIPSLDEILGHKGFYAGSSILISGTAGTGKTSIVVCFANRFCMDKKKCLFCAFEETPNQVIRNMKSVGMQLQPHVDTGLLEFYYARPSLQNLELHFMAIRKIIENYKPEGIILDPITNLMTEGTNSDIRSMLIRFIDYIKSKKITIVFSAAITVGSIERNPSDEGISSMVDSWVMLQDKEVDGERVTSMYVMKSRGMNHLKKELLLKMSSEGIGFVSTNK